MPAENLARVHIWVMGRVQGVGFRAFVVSSAAPLGVTGWVRNLAEDCVEALGEGTPEQLERFIRLVLTGPSVARVKENRVEYETATGEFARFEIRSSR
jgi:acylphosphatase